MKKYYFCASIFDPMKSNCALIFLFILSIQRLLAGNDTSLLDSVYYSRWDSIAQHWEKEQVQINSYDAQRVHIHSLYKNWQENTQQYVNYRQTGYSYLPGGEMSESVTQEWNGNAWVNYQKCIYTYNGAGLEETTTYFNWQSGSWVYYLQYLYTYDNQNYLTYTLEKLWNIGTGSWDNFVQIFYTNLANGDVDFSIMQSWSQGNWMNIQKVTYTYTITDKVETATYFSWDYLSSNWANSLKIFYTYDAGDLLVNFLEKLWSNSTWKNYYQINYTHNPDGTIHTYTSQFWRSSSSSWKNYQHAEYVYFMIVNVDDLPTSPETCSLYPNPTSGLLFIESKREEPGYAMVFSPNGKLLQKGNYRQIDLSPYPDGMYFIHLYISTGKAIETHRIIKNQLK